MIDPGEFVPILGVMGIRVLEAERGRAVAEMPAEPNVNHFGAAYAGSLFSLGECLGGVIAMSSFDLSGGLIPLLKNLHIDFRRPAIGPIRASVSLPDAEIDRVSEEASANGRSEFELAAELTDESGTVVASTVGTYQLRRIDVSQRPPETS